MGKERPELPNEIWIEILSAGKLDYFDLKRVAGVSKKFKNICELPTFDEALFRGTPQATLPQRAKVTIHPVLDHGRNFIGEKYQNFVIHADKVDHPGWKIVSLTCAREFATSPPVQTIILGKAIQGDPRMRIGGGGTVTSFSGVTVEGLLVGIAAAWRKRATFNGELS
ncbi:hypothetical protein P7C70_g979, partial [Phenoliferia sp. Uapishka_3]